MKTQKIFDLIVEGFLISENPLIASDLLLGYHMTGYGDHFENINSATHKYRF